jgi:hypothetical protein
MAGARRGFCKGKVKEWGDEELDNDDYVYFEEVVSTGPPSQLSSND